MMIWTARLSKRRAVLLILLLGALIALAILLAGRHEQGAQAVQLSSNEERVAYLTDCGWEVTPEPVETLQFLLPRELSEPYATYNELQLQQGFDLSESCGKQVERYTYAVTNYPGRSSGVQINLYVCEKVPVAGDVCCPGAGGFQQGLAFPGEGEAA